MTRRSPVPALERTMRLMDLLSGSPHRGFTITEIARELDVPKATVFNICGELVRGQWLRRSRDGVQLGRALLELGSAYAASVNVVSEFYQVCRTAPVDLGAVIQLAVLDDMDTVYLADQDCNSGLRLGLGGGVGRRVPANCTAGGKALLAALPVVEFDRRLARADALPRLTRSSTSSRRHLLREIDAARDTGYAYDHEGAIPGLTCIAAAFRTSHADGGFVAVSISAATETATDERREAIRATLDGVVAELSRRL